MHLYMRMDYVCGNMDPRPDFEFVAKTEIGKGSWPSCYLGQGKCRAWLCPASRTRSAAFAPSLFPSHGKHIISSHSLIFPLIMQQRLAPFSPLVVHSFCCTFIIIDPYFSHEFIYIWRGRLLSVREREWKIRKGGEGHLRAKNSVSEFPFAERNVLPQHKVKQRGC